MNVRSISMNQILWFAFWLYAMEAFIIREPVRPPNVQNENYNGPGKNLLCESMSCGHTKGCGLNKIVPNTNTFRALLTKMHNDLREEFADRRNYSNKYWRKNGSEMLGAPPKMNWLSYSVELEFMGYCASALCDKFGKPIFCYYAHEAGKHSGHNWYGFWHQGVLNYDSKEVMSRRDALNLEPSHVANCVSKGKSEHFDCRNHIRVIQPMGDGSRLYVCGTNAHSPKDWVLNANLTHLGRNIFVPGIGLGIAKCPYDPADNSTAVWVENGNPGDLPGLYSGTNAEFTKADTVIFRTDLYNFTTGRREFSFKRTLKYDSKWLDKPNFVGSFDIGDYVLFFFRERAVEYINCGKSVYSRVARVCKKDTGGKNILSQNWATYLKARLNCSIPGEFPFYFNEIQSVYKVPGDDSHFYGTFTTASNGLMGSAICSFTLKDIQNSFTGKFKEQASSSSTWLPVLTSKVPEPRPGTCVNDTETLPDKVLNFIRSHPLMDSAVSHENEKPVFYKRDTFFTKLVVDKIRINMLGVVYNYTVYYAGTNDGRIHKVVQWYDSQQRTHTILLDIFDVTPGESIEAMELSPKHKTLYIASDRRIKQVALVMCNRRYDNCLRCVHDPYCGWDKDLNVCKPYSIGLLQDVSNSTSDVCDSSVVKKKLVVTWGQSLHLGCFLKMPAVLATQTITWYHYSKEKGRYQIMFRPDKYIETSEHGLVIISVTEEDAGRYDCWMGASLLCSYNVSVDSHRCLTPNKSNEYHRIYTDWCHEFEKYKSAMKAWEKRQAQCFARQNEVDHFSHANETLRSGV